MDVTAILMRGYVQMELRRIYWLSDILEAIVTDKYLLHD